MRAEFYAKTEQQLREALEDHWLQAKGIYGFHVGRKVYWDGKERAKPGDNFDAAVVTAAVHSRLTDGRYSLLDDRIRSSVEACSNWPLVWLLRFPRCWTANPRIGIKKVFW